MHAHAGRSKASIIINLKSADGKRVFFDLVARADVVVTNFRPGVTEKLGIDYSACHKINPGIIYLSFTGFGKDGPLSSMRVYDPVIQALSGACALHQASGEEALVPQALMDKLSALEISQAILAALCARKNGRGGQHVSVSMLNVGIYSLWPYFTDGMFSEEDKRDYLGYAQGQELFENMNEGPVEHLINEEALLDTRFSEQEAKVFSSIFGAYRVAKFPVDFLLTPVKPREACAMLGEHTNLVLSNLGYTRAQRKQLVSSGAVNTFPAILSAKNQRGKARATSMIEFFQRSPILKCPLQHRSYQPVTRKAISHHKGPLAGLKVLELAYGVAGPVCGRSLVDRGAMVVKVELDEDLDPSRKVGMYGREDFGSMFAALNSGKLCRLLSLRKSNPEDEAEMRRLVCWADVILLDSTLEGKLEGTTFDYGSIRHMNTNAIVLKVVRELNEAQLQGLSGMSYSPFEESPQISGIPMIEIATGNYAAGAVLAAYANGNEGETITVSMTSCAYHFTMFDIHINLTWLAANKMPDLRKVFQLVELQDGTKVFSHCVSDKEWQDMRSALIEPHVKGSPWEGKLDKWETLPGRMAEIDDIFACIRHCAKNYTYSSYLALAQKHGMMCGRVNNVRDIKEHPQVIHQKLLRTVHHRSLGEYVLIRPPADYMKTPNAALTAAHLPDEGRVEVRAMIATSQ